MKRTFRADVMTDGMAEGVALVSGRGFTFAHGVDPRTGIVRDAHSDLKGESVRGRILFYPHGKGSTTGSAWFLEAVRRGNAPLALVTEGVDPSSVVGSVLARLIYGKVIPVMKGSKAYHSVKSGDIVTVDTAAGKIIVESRPRTRPF